MTSDIELIILDCGHSFTPYVGFGICKSCGARSCSRCMANWTGDLLCARCYCKVLRGEL